MGRDVVVQALRPCPQAGLKPHDSQPETHCISLGEGRTSDADNNDAVGAVIGVGLLLVTMPLRAHRFPRI